MMHVVLQAGSQSHALRLQLYASSPHLQALPHARGFAALLRNLCVGRLRCRYVVRMYWLEYVTSSRSELISHLNTLIQRTCRDETSFLGSKEITEYGDLLAESDSENTPLYHLSTPVCDGSVSAIHDHWRRTLAEKDKRKLKVRLQTYPRNFAESLVNELRGIDCQLHGFSQSLYALEVDGSYRYGFSRGTQMYLAPCDREDLAKDYIARAALKLEEVTQVYGFDLTKHMIAMDLGASPGAWTQFLCRHIHRVVAVDPAELREQALQPNVTHIRKLAQDATEELVAWSEGKGYDILVCDVNRHPVEAANLVSSLLPYLKTGGLLVLTLKFHGRGRDKEQKINEIKGVFQKDLTKMDCIWLLANSIYERTFVGIKV